MHYTKLDNNNQKYERHSLHTVVEKAALTAPKYIKLDGDNVTNHVEPVQMVIY